MKVLHVINTLSVGGAELHLLTLCRHLKPQGVECVVACLKEYVKGSRSLRRDFESENIRVINLDADCRYNLSFLRRILRLIKNEKPQILHTHLPRADIAGAFALRMGSPLTFVCSVHGIYRDRWFGFWAAPLMRRAYRRADGVIAISAAVKDWLHLDLGIGADRVKVIYYGIEPHHFAHLTLDQTENGGVGRRLTIGSVGRLEPGKGFDCLIYAMAKLRQRLPHAVLYIAGHDPLGYGTTLEALIAKLNLREQVKLVGFQSDIASFLSHLDVFAFASKSEGFGQVVIEAMAARKPVIASKLPPLTEIILHGETGLLVEPGNPEAFADVLSWLSTHPEERLRIGELGQERVRRDFSAEKMAEETLRLYDETIRQTSTQRTLAL